MNYNHPIPEKTAGVIRYSCGFLFMAFSFAYLYFMQGDLLAEAQYVFSNGVTHYSLIVGAVVVTVVLQLLQWIVSLMVHVPSRWHALTYFPSFLALTMLTDFSEDTIAHFRLGAWVWAAPLLLLLFGLLAVAVRHIERNLGESWRHDFPSLLWVNYLVLLVLILFCGSCHSAPDTYLYELKTERLLLAGKDEAASRVGIKSLATTPRLNRLRMFALARQGQLPEHLFDYPQPFGPDGLITIADTDRHIHRITSSDICFALGAVPDASVRTTERYFRLLLPLLHAEADSLTQAAGICLAASDTMPHDLRLRLDLNRRHLRTAYDYHLCRLLLQKDLKEFEQTLPVYGTLHDVPSDQPALLPRAYREAVALIHPAEADSATLSGLHAYRQLRESLADSVERKNRTRRAFGNTFWWYYDYQ